MIVKYVNASYYYDENELSVDEYESFESAVRSIFHDVISEVKNSNTWCYKIVDLSPTEPDKQIYNAMVNCVEHDAPIATVVRLNDQFGGINYFDSMIYLSVDLENRTAYMSTSLYNEYTIKTHELTQP